MTRQENGPERDALPAVIETPRLRLRPWRLADVGDVLAYARDPEWSRFLRTLPLPYGPEDAERFLARQVLRDPVEHPAWGIEYEGSVIGGINLRFRFDRLSAEMGYAIARIQWNRGFCTEAARALIGAAFSTHPDLNRIHAWADHRNGASQRVMEKAGMQKEGVMRMSRVERGEVLDEAWFSIIRPDWRAWRNLEPRVVEAAD